MFVRRCRCGRSGGRQAANSWGSLQPASNPPLLAQRLIIEWRVPMAAELWHMHQLRGMVLAIGAQYPD
jgi:hypothetical protein